MIVIGTYLAVMIGVAIYCAWDELWRGTVPRYGPLDREGEE
jgi:hypothetical protein